MGIYGRTFSQVKKNTKVKIINILDIIVIIILLFFIIIWASEKDYENIKDIISAVTLLLAAVGSLLRNMTNKLNEKF
jgi:uncharacterized protein YpmB